MPRFLLRLMPGLRELLHYKREWWRPDLQAGLSVAAVSLPVSIAYAQLGGFSPITGLYSTVLPMIAYAFFGSSRQMIMGPDAATCAVFFATLAPLAVPGSDEYLALAVSITILSGLFCIVAGRFRLGFLGDFLSRPILIGLLNGVAVTILVSQSGKVLGLSLQGRDTIGQAMSLFTQWRHLHWPTVLLSAGTCGVFVSIKVFWPRGPAALLAVVSALLASFLLKLPERGVAIIGDIPSGFPDFVWPSFPHEALGALVPASLAILLVSFSSTMLTSRSFASRNGYHVDGNQDLVALGTTHLAAALSQGFAVGGSSSRTLVNDQAGGKSRMVSIVAALTVLLVLFFLTDVLAAMPLAALGSILVVSAVGLIDFGGLRELRRFSRAEHLLALATMAGVILFGVMSGIVVAVAIALLRFLTQVTRPAEQLFGRIPGYDGFYELAHYPEARAVPGLLIYRFESPLTFFNADYFRRRVTSLVKANNPRWVVIDAISMTKNDITGFHALEELRQGLAARKVQLVIAGRTVQVLNRLRAIGMDPEDTGVLFFPSRQAALAAYLAEYGPFEGVDPSRLLPAFLRGGTGQRAAETS
ncbi:MULTISPECIES: SulP family inorganic anion transporter [Dyella]|nr:MULTISPECIES: sulfate permease [Dyella]